MNYYVVKIQWRLKTQLPRLVITGFKGDYIKPAHGKPLILPSDCECYYSSANYKCFNVDFVADTEAEAYLDACFWLETNQEFIELYQLNNEELYVQKIVGDDPPRKKS